MTYKKCFKIFKGDEVALNEKLVPELDQGAIIKDIDYIGQGIFSVAIESPILDDIPVDPNRWPFISIIKINGAEITTETTKETASSMKITILYSNKFGDMIEVSCPSCSVSLTNSLVGKIRTSDIVDLQINVGLPEGYKFSDKLVSLVNIPISQFNSKWCEFPVRLSEDGKTASIIAKFKVLK